MALFLLVLSSRLAAVAGTLDDPIPHVTRYVPAFYTEAARRARIQGVVLVDVVVDSDGKIIDQHVSKSLPMGLPDNTLRPLPSWRFNRSRFGERRITLEFVFKIDSQETPRHFTFEVPNRLISWAPSPILDERPRICGLGGKATSQPNP